MSTSREREQCNSTIPSLPSSKYFRTPLCTLDLQNKEEMKRQLTCHQTVSKKQHSIPIHLTLITMVKPHLFILHSSLLQCKEQQWVECHWIDCHKLLPNINWCRMDNATAMMEFKPVWYTLSRALTCRCYTVGQMIQDTRFTTAWITQVEHQKKVKPKYGEHQGISTVNFYRLW